MLILEIPIKEYYDETSEKFVVKTFPIALEHSLLSLSKWEEKYEKPFLSENEEMSTEEVTDYIRMMVVNPAVDPSLLNRLTNDNLLEIQKYINKKATATTVRDDEPNKRDRTIITAEVIYYWMFSLQIPKECETWHINKLLMLIRVFNAKAKEADPKNQKTMSKSQLMARNAKLNAKRLAGGRKG